MNHDCSADCGCAKDFDEAAKGLARASRLLRAAIAVRSDDMMENCWAQVRAAKAKVQGARAVYVEHRRSTSSV